MAKLLAVIIGAGLVLIFALLAWRLVAGAPPLALGDEARDGAGSDGAAGAAHISRDAGAYTPTDASADTPDDVPTNAALEGSQDAVQALIDGLGTPASALLTPVTFAAVEQTPLEEGEAGAVRVLLIDGLMAQTPFDSLSFTATDLGGQTVGISAVALSGPLTLMGSGGREGESGGEALTLTWESLDWQGTYDVATAGYRELDISLAGLRLDTAGAAGATSVTVETLSLRNVLNAGDLATRLIAQGLTAEMQIDSTTIRYTLPEAEVRGTTLGLGPGGNRALNPFAALPLNTTDGQAALPLASLGQAGDFTFTAAPATLTLEDFSLVTLAMGALEVSGAGAGYQVAGAGTATYALTLAGLDYSDPASGLTVKSGPLTLSTDLEGLDYRATLAPAPEQDQEGQEDQGDRLGDPAGGTYTRLARYLENGLQGRLALTLSDVEIADSEAALDARLASHSLTLGFAQNESGENAEDAQSAESTDGATLTLALALDGLTNAASVPDGLIAGLLPERARLSLRLTQIDMASLARTLRALPRSGSIEDEAAVAADLEAGLPALLDWFFASGAHLRPALSYAADALTLSLEGDMPLDGAAVYGLRGGMALRIDDFPGFQARVNAAQQSPSPNDSGLAQGLSGALLFLPAFGQPEADGTLTLELSFDEQGRPKLNDIFIPGF